MTPRTWCPFISALSRVDSDDLPLIVSRETLQQPEFERKKVQNVSKEGFSIDRDTDAAKARKKAVKEKFDPFLKWLGEDSLGSFSDGWGFWKTQVILPVLSFPPSKLFLTENKAMFLLSLRFGPLTCRRSSSHRPTTRQRTYCMLPQPEGYVQDQPQASPHQGAAEGGGQPRRQERLKHDRDDV